MKKTFLLTLCLLLPLWATSASARTLKIPEDNPRISLTLPDSWSHDDTDKGITCQSPDTEASIFFEVTDAKGLNDLIDENVNFLKEQKVQIDQSSKKSMDFKSNGLDWSAVQWDGKDESGDETIILAFADVGKNKVLMVTYWVTKNAEKKQRAALDKILDSIKKL